MASIVGSIYGGIAAYFGGVVDDVMMRIVEILLSVPYLLIVIFDLCRHRQQEPWHHAGGTDADRLVRDRKDCPGTDVTA